MERGKNGLDYCVVPSAWRLKPCRNDKSKAVHCFFDATALHLISFRGTVQYSENLNDYYLILTSATGVPVAPLSMRLLVLARVADIFSRLCPSKD